MDPEPADGAQIFQLWDGVDAPFWIDDAGPEVSYAAPAGLAVGTTFLRNISDPDAVGVYTAQRKRR